eukprot:m.1365889 g.1365889  ORF g.1365889 m.1365889 type:complete len:485 (+) comp24949_c0_seq5:6402-7856(+)
MGSVIAVLQTTSASSVLSLSFFDMDTNDCILVVVEKTGNSGSGFQVLHIYRFQLSCRCVAHVDSARINLTVHYLGAVDTAEQHAWNMFMLRGHLCYRRRGGGCEILKVESPLGAPKTLSRYDGQVRYYENTASTATTDTDAADTDTTDKDSADIDTAHIVIVGNAQSAVLARVDQSVRVTEFKLEQPVHERRVDPASNDTRHPAPRSVMGVSWVKYRGKTLVALVLSSQEIRIYRHGVDAGGHSFQSQIVLNNVVIDQTNAEWQPLWHVDGEHCLLAFKASRAHRCKVVWFDLENRHPISTLYKIDHGREIVQVGFFNENGYTPTPWLVHSDHCIGFRPLRGAVASVLTIFPSESTERSGPVEVLSSQQVEMVGNFLVFRDRRAMRAIHVQNGVMEWLPPEGRADTLALGVVNVDGKEVEKPSKIFSGAKETDTGPHGHAASRADGSSQTETVAVATVATQTEIDTDAAGSIGVRKWSQTEGTM